MTHNKIIFPVSDAGTQEAIIALLQEAPLLTGFEQEVDKLTAYFDEGGFDRVAIRDIAKLFATTFTHEKVEARNWNAEWESNFEPVSVSDFCYIRADFHPAGKTASHEIIITPKMSFGTGHHATTQMMITLMRDIDFLNKKTLDFGTGTGVLAILAEKLGARQVTAIDNDSWSHENAVENCERNKTNAVQVLLGDIETIPFQDFDIILANINRHILLQYMPSIAEKLLPGGTLLLSGILANEDIDIIVQCAADNGFSKMNILTKDKWAAMRFRKQ